MIVMVASMGLWSLVRSQEVPERTTVKAHARHEVAELFQPDHPACGDGDAVGAADRARRRHGLDHR